MLVSEVSALGENNVTFLLIIAEFNLESTAFIVWEWEMKTDSPSQHHSAERWTGANYEST